MKRLFAFIIVICIIASTMSLTVSAETDYSDIYGASEALRKAMTERETSISVYCKALSAPTREMLERIFELAIEESDDPKAGDYLHWHIESFKASGEYWTYGGVYYCDLIYEVKYYTTSDQEAELDKAVAELINSFGFTESTDDYTKISTAYNYICDNVDYYYGELRSDIGKLKYTAYSALIGKTAVCQGYANLFYRLMRELDIDCRIITGTSNGANHAWNIVKLGGLYYNADCTWDSETVKNKYFLKCQFHFDDHARNDEFKSLSFVMNHPMALSCHTVVPEVSECEKTGHDMGEWKVTREPNCTENGEEQRACSRCAYTETHILAAKGHTEGNWTSVKEPEIGLNGLEELRCTDCNTLLSQRETAALPPEGQAVLGDVNGNGTIEKYDYILVKRVVMCTIVIDDSLRAFADVNKNGKVEKYDYILVKRHVMKTFVIEGFPAAA